MTQQTTLRLGDEISVREAERLPEREIVTRQEWTNTPVQVTTL
jgi:hypothetical protein